MNTQNAILKRLLKLYPIKEVKEHFNLKGTFDGISDKIVSQYKAKSIFDFAATNINYTRQHVFVFDLRPNFNANTFSTAGFPLSIYSSKTNQGELMIHCFPLVEFDVIVTNPFTETTIKFFQPIRIVIKNKNVLIQITTLEKNLSHYFGEDRKVVDSDRRNGQEEWEGKILSFIGKKYKITNCDLHKGVKKVWDDKRIDSKYIKSKESKGTNTIAMDENYTVREEYPDKYTEIMKNPILKTLFKYKKPDDYFCDHFTIDPVNGEFAFTTFPLNLQQVENVINEILKHNQ